MNDTINGNEFLSIADGILWTPNPFITGYRPATVTGITMDGAKILTVRWKHIGQCQIQLDNGNLIDGYNTLPANKAKTYSYPEAIRLN